MKTTLWLVPVAGRRMVPHDRAFMLRTFDQDLRPFVDQIVDERAMDATEGSVRITLAQRSTLHKFASPLPGAHGGWTPMTREFPSKANLQIAKWIRGKEPCQSFRQNRSSPMQQDLGRRLTGMASRGANPGRSATTAARGPLAALGARRGARASAWCLTALRDCTTGRDPP